MGGGKKRKAAQRGPKESAEDTAHTSGQAQEESRRKDEEDMKELREAVIDYAQSHDFLGDADTEVTAGLGEDGGISAHRNPESDSSEDERPSRNTVGDVPLKWYHNEKHIGYNLKGQKLLRREKKDNLDSFLEKADNSRSWRTIYDEYNDEDVELTPEEIDIITRIRQGRIPHASVNPYEPLVDWFSGEKEIHPLSAAPEPKRRFTPSKWEAKLVVRLVRAIRNGWIKLETQPEKPRVYLLWGDDLRSSTTKTPTGLPYIAAPKPALPGHAESYNPPEEYLPTPGEPSSNEGTVIAQRFDSLRKVPAYKDFIKERFERCLDLYLCPRQRKRRVQVNPAVLLPQLPRARELQPYPSVMCLEFRGHTGVVSSIATDPSGQWLLSGSLDGTVRLWDVDTARCCRTWEMPGPVGHVAWNPNPNNCLVMATTGKTVQIWSAEVGGEPCQASSKATLETALSQAALAATKGAPVVRWQQAQVVCRHGNGASSNAVAAVQLAFELDLRLAVWHSKGDYLATLTPAGQARAVVVHQLSKGGSQCPFKRNMGRVQSLLFHHSRPFLFVATRTQVRVYNLLKQELSKKLIAGVQEISSLALHPGGDNLVLGSMDKKVCWFDMDLSMQPYRTMRYHEDAVLDVAYHPNYPLFASSSDDGTVHVFHGMVYADLLMNPLIVPLKVLRGHGVVDGKGVLSCHFHPHQPWIFSAGADRVIRLFCN